MSRRRLSAECATVRAALPEVVDAEADPRVVRFVELHASACADCAAELAVMRNAMAVLGELEEIQASPDFEDRVMARVRAARLGRWSWADLADRVIEALAARPLPTAALAAAVVVALVVVVRETTPVGLRMVNPAPGLARVESAMGTPGDEDRGPAPGYEGSEDPLEPVAPLVVAKETLDERLNRSLDSLAARTNRGETGDPGPVRNRPAGAVVPGQMWPGPVPPVQQPVGEVEVMPATRRVSF